MNLSSAMFRYYRTIYRQSNKWLMPLIGWMIFLYLNYLVMPQEFTSTMLNSATFMFLLTAWASQTFLASLTPVMEQIIVTRLPKKENYWMQTLVFVTYLGSLLSLVSVALPIIINLVKNQGLFKRGISLEEIMCALVIHFVFSLIGGLVAMIIQPRYVFQYPKLSNVCLLIVGLISVVGNTMAEKLPGFHLVLWLFPPLSKLTAYFLENPAFSFSLVWGQLSVCLIYASVLVIVYRLLRSRFLYD